MQKLEDVGINLLNLFKDSKYTPFKQGDLVNHPNMTGYYYIFKNIEDPKFCIILNTSGIPYPSNLAKIRDFVFIIFNIKSLDYYLENLGAEYFPTIMEILDQNLNKKNERELPYGYYMDLEGNIKVDLKKANEVRKIFNRYIEVKSTRQIAEEMKTNFNHVRDILASAPEYMEMQEKILPPTKLKQVLEILAGNVKGGAHKKESTMDKIKEMRKKRKLREKQLGIKN